jgi:spore photoproduct lyase
MERKMFSRIFIEKDQIGHPQVEKILGRYPNVPTQIINKVEDVFGRVKKPYLQKRDDLQLFLGVKKGELVKEAPPAYGTSGAPHYYFVHAYNCIYECQYCYLQGYFDSPDIVLYLAHDEVVEEMKKTLAKHDHEDNEVWFHAGEFSDSLALSFLTNELPTYHQFLKEHPKARIELRTKSATIRPLENLEPLDNLVVSYSLSSEERIKKTDLKTPPLPLRLKAMEKLHKLGYKVAIHLDPIIYSENFLADYQDLITKIVEHVPAQDIAYVSIGVVRFTKDVYREVQRNYPDSDIHHQELARAHDEKVRYIRPMRQWMLGQVQNMLYQAGLTHKQVYQCMEDGD